MLIFSRPVDITCLDLSGNRIIVLFAFCLPRFLGRFLLFLCVGVYSGSILRPPYMYFRGDLGLGLGQS